MKVLLVEPAFPIPVKSRNHAHFLPIGLLKIGTLHRSQGDEVHLVRGLEQAPWAPDLVLVTSLFTYWSSFVHDATTFYHREYPHARVEVGGVYASLMPDDCRQRSPFAEVRKGLYLDGAAEALPVDYSLLPEPVDYQIVHASRGCKRHCAFCGTWRIEPEFTYKRTILGEVQKPKVVFYDNNLLANPHIDRVLDELAAMRLSGGRRVQWECQSGLDLRYLSERRVQMLRQSRMVFPRIAWDGPFGAASRIGHAVNLLKSVGYGRRDIFIFMLYNHAIQFDEMVAKLDACRRLGVRVVDCRYRPLDATADGYRPGAAGQPDGSYFIYPGWTDAQVRSFRQRVRRQNIAVMLNLPDGRYIPGCESRLVGPPPYRKGRLIPDASPVMSA